MPMSYNSKYYLSNNKMDLLENKKKVEGESLPIIDSPKLSSTPNNYHYHLRITQPSFTKEEVAHAFKKLGWTKYLIGEEVSKGDQYHTHSYVQTDIPYNITKDKKGQKRFYTKVKEVLAIKEFSSSIMVKEELLSYVVKDGQYLAEGFDPRVLKEAEAKSYKKYSKTDFAKAQHEIENEYLTDKISLEKAIEKFINLKVSYKQNINRNWLKQYFTMLLFKHSPGQVKSYTTELVSSIQQDILGIRFNEENY